MVAAQNSHCQIMRLLLEARGCFESRVRVQGAGVRVQDLGPGLRVQALVFRVQAELTGLFSREEGNTRIPIEHVPSYSLVPYKEPLSLGLRLGFGFLCRERGILLCWGSGFTVYVIVLVRRGACPIQPNNQSRCVEIVILRTPACIGSYPKCILSCAGGAVRPCRCPFLMRASISFAVAC